MEVTNKSFYYSCTGWSAASAGEVACAGASEGGGGGAAGGRLPGQAGEQAGLGGGDGQEERVEVGQGKWFKLKCL